MELIFYSIYMIIYLLIAALAIKTGGIILFFITIPLTWVTVYITLKMIRIYYYRWRVNPKSYRKLNRLYRNVIDNAKKVLASEEKTDTWRQGFCDAMGLVDYCMLIEKKKLGHMNYEERDVALGIIIEIMTKRTILRSMPEHDFTEGQNAALELSLLWLSLEIGGNKNGR